MEVKRGNETVKAYYCLFGNLLYSFEAENDTNSLTGLLFLESSKCKIVASVFPMLQITTVGGRLINLTSAQPSDLQEWMDAIETNKFIQVSRKLDDMESTLLQHQHATEQQSQLQMEYDHTLMEYKQQMVEMQQSIDALQASVTQLNKDKQELKKTLKQSESERLLLLKSRGITPKSVPQWALQQESSRRGVLEPLKSIKIWTGTWSLGGKEPFAGMEKERAKRLLQPFVPDGYDLYVLAVQDCVSESVFECFDALQTAEGCRRLRLTQHGNHNTHSTDVRNEDGSDPTRIYGRGDGSLKSLKFTSMVVYARSQLLGDIKLVSLANFPVNSTQCKGAVAAVVQVLDRTIAFVGAHLDRKSNDLRRDQYQSLFMSLGNNLGEADFHLNEQFHHVVWMGDLGYNLVDTSGNTMPPESALTMLQDGRLLRTLFDSHDELNHDKKQQLVFYGYRESTPFPNFYPTYKKLEHRPPVNYHANDWVKSVYCTQIKEPFYRGGKVREWTPCFPDRILYCSMADLVEDLLPESVPADMNIEVMVNNTNTGSSKHQAALIQQQVAMTAAGAMVVRVDNYRSVNDGEGMSASDHSPVFATFLLRLRHDHNSLVQTPPRSLSSTVTSPAGVAGIASASSMGMRGLLSALASSEQDNSASSEVLIASKGGYTTPPVVEEAQAPAPSINANANGNAIIATPSRYALLPHGVYRIRLTEMRMVWGCNEESPCHVSLLFPAPFEAVAGEKFVEFQSDNTTSSASSASNRTGNLSDDYSMSMQSADILQQNTAANRIGATGKSMSSNFNSPTNATKQRSSFGGGSKSFRSPSKGAGMESIIASGTFYSLSISCFSNYLYAVFLQL